MTAESETNFYVLHTFLKDSKAISTFFISQHNTY